MSAPHSDQDTPARLVIGGEPVDLRTREARRFRDLLADLTDQLDGDPTPAERMQLVQAATLQALCERGTAALLRGEAFEPEDYRRNVTALRSVLTALGLAMKSRDITKGNLRRGKSALSAMIEGEAEEV